MKFVSLRAKVIIFPVFINLWNQFSDIIHNSCTQPMGASIPLMMFSSLYTVAKFIVPDWGDKVDSGIRWYRSVYRYDWRTGTITLCRSQLYSTDRELEFGYCTVVYHFGTKTPLVSASRRHLFVIP
jgi:hypothetical protein